MAAAVIGAEGSASRIAAHAAVGGASEELQGGKFAHGALAGAFGHAASSYGPGGRLGGTITAAVSGGVAAEIGGGKFANGAASGAFGYLFNACFKNGCYVTSEERRLISSKNYDGYYALACTGGDTYACVARDIAADRGFFARLANMRLETFVFRSDVVSNRAQTAPVMERFRLGLATAYVRYLDKLVEAAKGPAWPARDGIEEFHNEVFKEHGVKGKAFAGPIADAVIPKAIFDYCSICR